jgi:hypothetical protein
MDTIRLTSDHNKQTRVTRDRELGGAKASNNEDIDSAEGILEHEARTQRDTAAEKHAEFCPCTGGAIKAHQTR